MTFSPPAPEKVKAARLAAGLTQVQCAEIFGYKIVGHQSRGWQQKETVGINGRKLTIGEWQFLLLLAGQHPGYALTKRVTPGAIPGAPGAAFEAPSDS